MKSEAVLRPDALLKKSKVVATIGPKSNTKEMLREFILAGVDVFRLNFSHGDHAFHKKNIDLIRELSKELNTQVAILQDLQGPKIRTNKVVDDKMAIEEGQEVTFIYANEDFLCKDGVIYTSYETIAEDIKPGERIFINDGHLELVALRSEGKKLIAKVIYGGDVENRKGINLPDSKLSVPSLTKEDYINLEFGLQFDLDWVALSFVRTAQDIQELQDILNQRKVNTKIIAKIEKPEAIKNIDAIIRATDAVMVARGDLGVEMRMVEVPAIQKMIIKKCNEQNKPVIVATQMLESMKDFPKPTRAEVGDVANAILDGADAVMLSVESANGNYPLESVKTMVSVIVQTENDQSAVHKTFMKDSNSKDKSIMYYKYLKSPYSNENDSTLHLNDKIIRSSCRLASTTNIKAILTLTKTGYTAFRISRHRPNAHIYVFTNEKHLINQLSLLWGIKAFYYNKESSINETFLEIEKMLYDKGLIKDGDVIIDTGSMPLHWQGRTNMLKINVVNGKSYED